MKSINVSKKSYSLKPSMNLCLKANIKITYSRWTDRQADIHKNVSKT